MIVYLDTSVLVAALVEDEPAHEAALRLLRAEGNIAWSHAIAEAYSTLTGGRLGLRVAPPLAELLLRETLLPRIELVDIPGTDLPGELRRAADAGARGGAVFDYLHLAAARRAGAAVLYTLDVRHFAALAREGDPRIEAPES